ncbi:MAG: excinuclease ABC subunit UvrC [Sodaliphilus pleomorphus]|uniref:excinuclease ABC subunit UvrC n=1 Tax=Sodaliphilus pleomorphus TaxID=2606626 RepID=UPI00240A42A3|nr:excinuclease ABC subunit UvrC [Sodaliphilus pleomorphus]MDD6474380.1 excinuclease ABC subunit UvrC [Sodaliphilus pleomorphus]
MIELRPELKAKLQNLPSSPGVYRYLDKTGKVIYVGKAKNLHRRVNSYFNRVHPVRRTNMLVHHIWDLVTVVVNTEEEALDLENSLIKQYQPHYNVLLKDDKSYPWICVTKEPYPRVYMSREKPNRAARFYGPYPKVEVARALIGTIREIFPIRSCRYNLTPESIQSGKFRLCLKYHLKSCPGCCKGYISVEDYGKYIDEIKQILNGDTKQVSDYLMGEMQRLSRELKFEEANELKRRYLLIEKYRAKSVIVNPSIHNIDVFTILRDDTAAYVNFIYVRNGSVVQCLTLEYKLVDADSDETDAELISTAMREIHERFKDRYDKERVREALVNVVPEYPLEGTDYIVPQRGDKKKLLDISLKNAEQYRVDKYKLMEKLNPEQRVTRTLTRMQRDLHLTELPRHIECFDNSNIGGTSAVASCVVFRDAKPAKREYRSFNIKTVEGPDDYASMREVLTRRYSRLLDEGQELPQLVVLDGGKGQLSAAVQVLDELGLRGRIAAIGIAKRMNEIFFPGDSVPLYIDLNGETIRVIQHLRDEAHRFGIAHHRNKRSKSQIHSELDDIAGIGPKSKTLLLKHFKSLKRLREATVEEVAAVVGAKRAQALKQALQSK